MSLLMDALKRAESSKQEAARAQSGREVPPPPGGELSLEPVSANEPEKGAGSPLPDLAKHRDAVDADLAKTAQPGELPRPLPLPPTGGITAGATATADGRTTARNAFAAKQPPQSKGPFWLVVGTLGIAGLAIGTYVWYQLQSMNKSSLAPPPSGPRPPITSAPPASPAVTAAPVNQPPVLVPSGESAVAAQPVSGEAPRFAAPPPAARQPRPPQAEREAVADTPPIRLARTRPEPDANLLRGHANIQRNDLEAARRDFEQALLRDPNNTDALLAQAAIAQRQGRATDAEGWYRRALVANPSDPAVQAAVLNGAAAGTDPQTTESRLKTLLAGQPESAPLNFALGNLYARQNRWAEAQQAYFNAVAGEGDNPDYLFNLAVSLDHIRQGRPAAQHYRLALEAAEKRPAAFDREQVRKRLAELQPERHP